MVRPVDFQSISAQTPGVEKSHQNRPQQADVDQRAQHTVAQDAQDQKMRETQETPQEEAAEMRLQAEAEGRRRGRKRRQGEEPDTEEPAPPARPRDPNRGGRIDITI